VTSAASGKSVELRINDRGPFVGNRIIDVSFAAAKVLDMIGPGTAEVVIEVLSSPVPLSEVPTLVRYTVQLGSYSSRAAADAARERLSGTVRGARVVATQGSQTLFRVRAGDFSDIDEARSEAARLKRQGMDAIVVER
jgi:rare lipoprotein A